ncbi:MAG: cyclopropane-fatty-acyl-phospholipid synthase family protein [Gammaproteobacteria bacterium]|nr:cyclopropane-fatty-acyl-phospholipid synthase family protein [Gammaproteobacteria bacterium]
MKKTKATVLSIPSVTHGIPAYELTRQRSPATALERWLARKLLALAGNPPLRLVLWDGEEITTSTAPALASMSIRHRAALYKLFINPNLHFGDLYTAGSVEVEGNFIEFLESVYRASASKFPLLRKIQAHLFNRPRSNTLSGSSTNIHHHYDLSNEFYELWLDKEMQYTCAYFPSLAATLEQAQFAKMDHVCRKLRLRPGERVVEAGCGWGGLARHMARHYGVTVHSYNISKEQLRYARERAKAEGLSGVEYIEDDYRNISGKYDAFVSVGMLEHVGLDHYHELGDVIHRALTEHGRGLIHSIGRNHPELMNAWIEKRIFPGAYPPTLGEMMDIFEPHDLSVLDVENLRLHYAKTLEHWLMRFEQNAGTVENMFDENFVRAWRLYLAGSLASFSTGCLQLFQVVFTRGANNQIPWTRAHLYEPGTSARHDRAA